MVKEVSNGSHMRRTSLSILWPTRIRPEGFKKGACPQMPKAMRAKTMFGEIKRLMAVSGFKWDESRKLVSAEAVVWDDYLSSSSDGTLTSGTKRRRSQTPTTQHHITKQPTPTEAMVVALTKMVEGMKVLVSGITPSSNTPVVEAAFKVRKDCIQLVEAM
ncbi:hypothetical protein AMTR_s00013p00256800 [Amborella trichopoda]|uniref:Myb/SANT-like domain-containing protein n=1 Tax=Amborella trichopoda TaxID=13333 RepID=W1PJ98_AMBTC|nr:hypothetical protein AMTR_s00013p00256800 [Amborella trichopoda]